MKPRHLVTLLVVGVPLVLLAGVLWRLNEAGASDGAVDGAASTDSLNEALGASAVEAFPHSGNLERRHSSAASHHSSQIRSRTAKARSL